MQKKKRWTKFRHRFTFMFYRFIFNIFLRIRNKYRALPFRPANKKQNYIIIANHTCTLDPFMMAVAFEFPIYFVASDEIFSIPLFSPFITYCVACIPKTKGMSDYGTIKTMMQVAKEGGSIGLFPEGDRTFDGTLQHIDQSIVRLFKLLKLPILIFNFEGEFGIDPRFGRRYRRGDSIGYVSTILEYDEYKHMDDKKLYDFVVSRMKLAPASYRYVKELRYKNARRAEYLERVLYVCADCKAIGTMQSRRNLFFCKSCGYTAEYLENATFRLIRGNTYFREVHNWNAFQKQVMSERLFLPREIIFEEKQIFLYEKTRSKPRRFINSGVLHLYPGKMVLYGKKRNTEFVMDHIVSMVVIGKRKLMVYTAQKSFLLQGKKTFGAFKYVQYFSILQTQVHTNKEKILSPDFISAQ